MHSIRNNKSAWLNFVTLAIGLCSYYYFKHLSSLFISKYGKKVSLNNIFKEGYLNDTMQILGLIFMTIFLLSLTIFISILSLKICISFISIGQIIISIVYIIRIIILSQIPYLGTLVIMLAIGGIIILIVNDN